MKLPKPKFAEAGPGAGKTHAMVDEIVAALQILPSHRFLAAVTYTNAAANTIRDRLSERVPRVRSNVFIGTIHSFVNRFVLMPCAELLTLLPEDRMYVAINPYDKVGPKGAAAYEKNLINKGIVPYSSMIPKARQVLETLGIRDLICGRIAYLFVDEFQDTDIGMFEVFEHFRKAEKTRLYVVGDSEQYVMIFESEKWNLVERRWLLTPIPKTHHILLRIADNI